MSFKTLYILRHAKARPGKPAEDDHARELMPQGEREAASIGAFMKSQGIHPQRVLCSTAVRTRATLAQVERELGGGLAVEFTPRIYHSTPDQLLALIHETPDEVESLMIVGHNPTLHQLAIDLTESGSPKSLEELTLHFPTAALAEISYPAEKWVEFGGSRGKLSQFVLPELLAAA